MHDRKINIYTILFLFHFKFWGPKNIRFKSTHYFIIKISDNKCELPQIAFGYLPQVYVQQKNTKCKKCT